MSTRLAEHWYAKHRVGGGVAPAVLPHHRTNGSVSGGSWGRYRSGDRWFGMVSACRVDGSAQGPYSRQFRRLPSGSARAFQPSSLHSLKTSNARCRTASTSSALRPPVSPGAPGRCSGLLWPRLTSAALSNRLTTMLARRHRGRSLRVRRATFLPYIRRIYAGSIRMTLGFESMRPLAHRAVASDAVRVPRTGSLPAASFRFRLAADTLAVRLGVPVIKASIGTYTRPVASRFAFARRFAASGYDAARHA